MSIGDAKSTRTILKTLGDIGEDNGHAKTW